MSNQNIKAGGAVVEVSIKDKISAGLNSVEKRLNSWAMNINTFSQILQGASVLSRIAGYVDQFIDSGSRLADTSARTGVAIDTLSELEFAAEQTGASLADVESGFKNLAKFEAKFASGSKEALATLDKLGLSGSALAVAEPDQKIAMIADALNGVADPGQRAVLAMQLLGKSGMRLLPMFSGGAPGLKELVDQAKKLNVVISEEQAAKADMLGDKWDALKKVWHTLAFKVGVALADALESIIDNAIKASSAAIDFVENNHQLVFWVAAASAGIVALGAFLSGVAVTIWTVAAAMTVMGTIMAACTAIAGVFGAAIAFMFTPLGAILAAAGAGLAAWVILTQTGRAAVNHLVEGFWSLLDSSKMAFSGISDAIVSGNWGLAGQIAMAFLWAAWVEGINRLRMVWIEFKAWFLSAMVATFGPDTLGFLDDMYDGMMMLVDAAVSFGKMLWQVLKDVFSIIGDIVNEVLKLANMQPISWEQPELKGQQREIRKRADNALSDAQKNIDKAKADLAKLTAEAAAERTGQEEKRLAAYQERFQNKVVPALPQTGSIAAQQGATFGTFSSFVTGLLTRSAPDMDFAKQTAENTGEMVEKLDEVKEAIEDQEGAKFD